MAELVLSLLDGLAGLLRTCSRLLLSKLLVQLADLVTAMKESALGECPPTVCTFAGIAFGCYAIRVVFLPVLQKWAHQEMRCFLPSSQTPPSARSLKQTTTVFTELVGLYVR